ncbi:MAG: 4Fe-4S dicluster domain-containing protein, partial [Chloroflexota bacterium]|nr:4Fe-4S dicluster domain-containing protein [Chloroflexota bacterium]
AHVGGYGAKIAKRRWAHLRYEPFGGLFMSLCMGLRRQVDGDVSPEKQACSPAEITKEIKRAAKYLGADMVGITTVKPDFTYSDNFSYEDSKVEVGPAATSPVDMQHKYIIVLGKEMDFQRINATLTENNDESSGEIGRTYYELANIACGLAAYIRHLGYPARAHHLRNEQVFLVPHAVDAGLGEQGRHNYLISAKHGPRVRLAGVTTSLELLEDKPVDIGVQQFCETCRLCALNCPAQALPAEKQVVRGYRKWTQDPGKCFRFWVSSRNTFACSMCLKVCPWNKPQTLVHKVSFCAVSRSLVARKLFYWLAVIYYGKRVGWTRIPLAEAA